MRNSYPKTILNRRSCKSWRGTPFQYGILRCDPSPDKRELLPDGTGRSSKKECVLPLILREALARLNPDIPGEKLEEIARDLCRDFSATDMTATTTSTTTRSATASKSASAATAKRILIL